MFEDFPNRGDLSLVKGGRKRRSRRVCLSSASGPETLPATHGQ
jgi:hypothetical protein